ncbi:hypothetical protein BT67DRAFT_5002 [Trichocladium antarcticum]|uniref:Uncharacterized protein n=1 Tax=Trichocladium antarcticum TaxID=1450529 RepID=A0AAN6USQ3_9PEZI|nr:hypothetical protein BT67DRAFT_5002 [Trichocladium antarcticum]
MPEQATWGTLTRTVWLEFELPDPISRLARTRINCLFDRAVLVPPEHRFFGRESLQGHRLPHRWPGQRHRDNTASGGPWDGMPRGFPRAQGPFGAKNTERGPVVSRAAPETLLIGRYARTFVMHYERRKYRLSFFNNLDTDTVSDGCCVVVLNKGGNGFVVSVFLLLKIGTSARNAMLRAWC